MTREDIIEMAREAGFADASFCRWSAYTDDLKRCAALVADAEREACAKVAERFEPDEKTSYVAYASTAIRKRGEQ